jgi:hypothetical protein
MKATPLSLKKKLALELWRQQNKLAVQEHPLRQLFWECTLRCDLKCRHCGSDCKMADASRDMLASSFVSALVFFAVYLLTQSRSLVGDGCISRHEGHFANNLVPIKNL